MAKKPKRSRIILDKLDKLLRGPPPPPPPPHIAEWNAQAEIFNEDLKARRHAEAFPTPPPPAQPEPAKIRHPVVEAVAPKDTMTGHAFDKAAQTSQRLSLLVFDTRFRSEPARASALDAMAQADQDRELNDQTLAAAVAKQADMINRLNGRAVWGEGGKAINDIVTDALAAHAKQKETIAFELDQRLYEAERLNPPGKGFKKPLRLTGPEPDSMEPFNQASTGTPNWRAIFYAAVEKGVTIEVAQAEMQAEPEPTVEPQTGWGGTRPEGGWLAHFNGMERLPPRTEPGFDMDL